MSLSARYEVVPSYRFDLEPFDVTRLLASNISWMQSHQTRYQHCT